jgi:phospholipid/cholesterol/gamma-HCH transport system permease protein
LLTIMGALQGLGRFALSSLAGTGRLVLFAGSSLGHCTRPPIYWRIMVRQLVDIGFYSLPVVGLTAIFTGMVLALQSHTGFSRFEAESAVATIVVLSMTRELGPVLAGLMVAGRVGASMAAEIGTMRVTEQIDALESLGRSPGSHLIVPRVLAGFIMIPVLVVLADVMGIFAGWFSMKMVLPITNQDFTYGARSFWRSFDATYSVIKAFFFAGSITIIACYMGFNTQQGADGVGRATTSAVVASSVLILLLDVVLANLLLS